MPDSTLSQAIKEAYASAPTSSIIYHTLEIYHPSFTVPIRVVRDTVNLTATLESTAPRDASTAVLFVGYQFDITPPEISTSGVPQCTIEIDNVSREILAQIENAVNSGSQELITMCYRAFLQPPAQGLVKNIFGMGRGGRITGGLFYLYGTEVAGIATSGFFAPPPGHLEAGTPENDPPLTLTVSDITANVFRISATAGFANLANKKFPNLDYTSEVFPGLIAQ